MIQGVISRASFRRQPRGGKSFFTVMSLHINNNYAKKRGIGKKMLLAIRAAMLVKHIDLVAGDFNGPAWRRQTTGGNLSIIEEAFCRFRLTDASWPHTLCGAQGQCQVLGQTFAGFSSLQTPMNTGKYVSMEPFPFSTKLWAFVPRIKVATMKCGYTWTSLTITAAMNRVKGTSNDFSSKKGLLLSNTARKGARQRTKAFSSSAQATIRHRHKRPYVQRGSHEHN